MKSHPMPLALSDSQLKIVMTAARLVEPEKRAQFLERLGAMLKLKHRFTDNDLSECIALALVGLQHGRTDSAA